MSILFIVVMAMVTLLTFLLRKLSFKLYKKHINSDVSNKKQLILLGGVLQSSPIIIILIATVIVFYSINTEIYKNLQYAADLTAEPFSISSSNLKDEDLLLTDKGAKLIDKFVTPRFSDDYKGNTIPLRLASHFIYQKDGYYFDYLRLVTLSEVEGTFALTLTEKELSDFRTGKISAIDESIEAIKSMNLKAWLTAIFLCLGVFISFYWNFSIKVKELA